MEQQKEPLVIERKVRKKSGVHFQMRSTASFQNLILIVNSNHYCAQLSASLLHKLGYATKIALCPAIAMNLIQDGVFTPDLILVEFMEQKEKAFQFPKLLRLNHLWSFIPAVAYSVLSDSQTIGLALKSGYSDYIQAPATSAIMRAKIEAAIMKSCMQADFIEPKAAA
jgi:PleD family two-component response regulator